MPPQKRLMPRNRRGNLVPVVPERAARTVFCLRPFRKSARVGGDFRDRSGMPDRLLDGDVYVARADWLNSIDNAVCRLCPYRTGVANGAIAEHMIDTKQSWADNIHSVRGSIPRFGKGCRVKVQPVLSQSNVRRYRASALVPKRREQLLRSRLLWGRRRLAHSQTRVQVSRLFQKRRRFLGWHSSHATGSFVAAGASRDPRLGVGQRARGGTCPPPVNAPVTVPIPRRSERPQGHV